MAEQTDEGKAVGGKQSLIISLVVIGLSLAYAIVRYNVVRDIPYSNLPLYIYNKAIALAATLLIGISYIMGPLARFWPSFRRHLHLRKHLGVTGFGVAALHAIISLVILTPAYYPRFFEPKGKMN